MATKSMLPILTGQVHTKTIKTSRLEIWFLTSKLYVQGVTEKQKAIWLQKFYNLLAKFGMGQQYFYENQKTINWPFKSFSFIVLRDKF